MGLFTSVVISRKRQEANKMPKNIATAAFQKENATEN
jgi:hypothetical protein